MKENLEAGAAGRKYVNGHELKEEFLVHGRIEDTGPDPMEMADREATRYLSAATQINIDYARNVVDRVLNEQLRALAPAFGVDIPVVVKWALQALRTRATRDRLLAAILVYQCFFIVVQMLWWRWAWVLFAALFAVAWLVVAWDHDERINKIVIGRMLHDRFRPEDAPSPTRRADLERLEAVKRRREGNLVVFSGHSAFIGTGRLLARQRLLLDVNGEKSPDGDSAGRPVTFTSHDLQTAIVAAFDRAQGLGKSLDNIRVYERLFVNGLHVKQDERLLPNPQFPPPASVNKSILREAALNPSPEARTYVCVEMPGWQGQLVVTLFIRAVYVGKLLFVEWTFRVLPPIRNDFRVIDTFYQRRRPAQVKVSLVSGTRELVPALLSSPVNVYRLWSAPRATERRQSRNRAAIRGGYVFDYGAERSIREDASGVQRHHYFLARDEGMYVLLAQQTLIRTVEEFLSGHGVDLGQFKDQVKVIFDQSINYNIGDISGSSGIAIGKNSSATVGDAPKE